MKNLLLLLLLSTFTINAQTKDCVYDVEEKTDSTSLKTLPHKLMNEKIFGNNKEFIFFGLLNNNGVPMLSLQQLQKNNDFIPTSCLSKNSKIIFQLMNGKIVTLRHAFDDVCSDLTYNSEEKNNIRILTAYFYFTKTNYEELKSSPISLMRIQFAGETKDFVLKNELMSETLKTTSNPASYFIEFLKCVE
ncbi:hypothetical protein NAT47_11010 [Flavobacterium sp. HXWNR69]|uniref:Uncharacterized protein n=1 Tax=Flavobacterium fragile TaxID=2949085 RepID=A0ABT0TIY9_9FLAO|nr:hypothetical protein [Flavobacterium sp. HXWNR69]MCL9770944.1 hypothetical protein [Flavobacterium sp. HXWNR69]